MNIIHLIHEIYAFAHGVKNPIIKTEENSIITHQQDLFLIKANNYFDGRSQQIDPQFLWPPQGSYTNRRGSLSCSSRSTGTS